ncbi:hypothetical protein D3C80_1102560 [compost metagenome]
MVADHVQSDEQQAFFAQGRADGGGDLAVALGQRAGLATAAGGQVAAGLAGGGNACQAVGHRLAVDHQDALVAVLDRRQVALRHDLLGAVEGEGLEDHREVRVAGAMAEDRRTAHAIKGFENDVTLFFGKLAQNVRSSADHGRRRQLGEQGGEELLVAVAQALRAVDHQHAGTFGLLQQVGGVDVLVVEGRVLAHQDHVQFGQRDVGLGLQLEPVLRVEEHLQRTCACASFTVFLV